MITKLFAVGLAAIASSTKLEDCSTTAQISSTDSETHFTLAQDWRSKMLAQTKQEETEKKHDCLFSITRLREGPQKNFYKIQKRRKLYSDRDFKGEETVCWADNAHKPSKHE